MKALKPRLVLNQSNLIRLIPISFYMALLLLGIILGIADPNPPPLPPPWTGG
ncbi:hypothetical protein [Candidatus Hodarchaeum mangrovi]